MSVKFKRYLETELNQIIFELKNHKAAIIDTDTIFGIISLTKDKIYKIKKRPFYKKIITFIADENLIPNLTDLQKEFLKKFWPGPVTIIKNGISYRKPNDPFLLEIIKAFGQLFSSSANISSKPPIESLAEVEEHFNAEMLYYQMIVIEHENHKKTKQESTVVNIDKFEIIRDGALVLEVQEWIDKHAENKK